MRIEEVDLTLQFVFTDPIVVTFQEGQILAAASGEGCLEVAVGAKVLFSKKRDDA